MPRRLSKSTASFSQVSQHVMFTNYVSVHSYVYLTVTYFYKIIESLVFIMNKKRLYFAGIVQGGTLPYICTQIMTIVDQEQSKVLWTPVGGP